LLLETVESILHGSELPKELIIIDQSKTPHPELIKSTSYRGCQIRYIPSNSTGVCRARNEGLAAARYDILILIDDDMQVPGDWFRSLVDALIEAGPECVVTGKVLAGAAEVPGGFVPALVENEKPSIFEGRIGTDVLPSCHMAMYRSVFQIIGGFDERLGPGTRFPAADDNDYGFRLLEAGYKIIYTPRVVIYHRAWRGDTDYYSLRWAYGRGKGGFYTKHSSIRDIYMLRRMFQDVMIRLIRFPWRAMHRFRLAVGDLYYVSGIIAGGIEWLLTYRR